MALGAAARSALADADVQDGILTLDASHPDGTVETGYLHAGGSNPAGETLGVNSRYFTRDGKPWIPTMGEFHFARYPRSEWREELLKMKAGGITIVSTYVFWIYHEEEEGKFNWSGNRDLGAFVDLCGQTGLLCYLRIGPWAHGEVRNGGLPDWVIARCGSAIRRDAEPYLTYARKYYQQVASQVRGRLWRDGGPIIGVQLDNELRNPGHLLTLKAMARQAGFDVPYYSMTGWDRAQVPPGGELLPVFGGYPDGFWIAGLGPDRGGRRQYFFGLERDDSVVGDDLRLRPGAAPTGYLAHYPYATCEIGGGMEVSYRRRPVIGADDVAAEALVKLGSGSNLQGYYLYHGGADPLGKDSTLNETRATGYPNDMPEINYDFQAPLRQYGQPTPAYGALRAQHLFLADFGPGLAPLPSIEPDSRPGSIDDTRTLRWAVRSDGHRGYLFVNNYQHLFPLAAHGRVQFRVNLADGPVLIPDRPVRVRSGAYFVWPIRLDLGGATLAYATAQPLCRVGDCWVFFAAGGVEPQFVFDPATLAPGQRARIGDLRPGTDCVFTVHPRTGPDQRVMVLTSQEATQAWKVHLWGEDRLILSEDGIVVDGEKLQLRARRWNMSFAIFPSLELALHGRSDGIFTRFQAPARARAVDVRWHRVDEAGQAPPVRVDAKGAAFAPDDAAFEASAGEWEIDVPPHALDGGPELYLMIDYVGDMARAYVGGRLIDDDFFFGRPWEIGLSRFAPDILSKELTVRILPLRRDAPIYLPANRQPASYFGGQAVGIRGAFAEPEYEVTVKGPAGRS